MLISLLRRMIMLGGTLIAVGFALLYLHNLQVPSGLPLYLLALGSPLLLAALLLNGFAMVKSDDYLIPPHTFWFYLITSLLVAAAGLGLFGLLYFSDRFSQAYLLYFGFGPLLVAVIFAIFSLVRVREAHTMPEEYRAEPAPVLAWMAASTSVLLLAGSGLLLSRVVFLQMQATAPEFQWETRPTVPLTEDERERLGRQFFQQARAAGDQYRVVHDLYLDAAEHGHVEAMYELGVIYSGEGFLRDPNKALEFFRRAEALGHVEASHRLGRIFRHGELGFPIDYERAYQHFLNAARRGHVTAQTQLGNMYNRGEGREINYERAFHWFFQAAQQGDAIAQNDVGIYYINGRGVEQNIEAGLQWLGRAADQGVAVAEYNLGRAFYDGELVPRDFETAARHFQNLARQNIVFGILMMGRLHFEGKGVPQDYEKAFGFLATAARRGHPEAEYYAGLSLLEGLGTERDTHAAMALIENAGRRGIGPAQMLLGNLYLEGNVIARDPVEGTKWLMLATRNGVDEAEAKLAEVRADITDSDWNYAHEMANALQARREAGRL